MTTIVSPSTTSSVNPWSTFFSPKALWTSTSLIIRKCAAIGIGGQRPRPARTIPRTTCTEGAQVGRPLDNDGNFRFVSCTSRDDLLVAGHPISTTHAPTRSPHALRHHRRRFGHATPRAGDSPHRQTGGGYDAGDSPGDRAAARAGGGGAPDALGDRVRQPAR